MADDSSMPFNKEDLHDGQVKEANNHNRGKRHKYRKTSTCSKVVQVVIFVAVLAGIAGLSYFLFKHYVQKDGGKKKAAPAPPPAQPTKAQSAGSFSVVQVQSMATKAQSDGSFSVVQVQSLPSRTQSSSRPSAVSVTHDPATPEPEAGIVNPPLPYFQTPSESPCKCARLESYHEWAGTNNKFTDANVEDFMHKWLALFDKSELYELPPYIYLDYIRCIPDVYLLFLRLSAGEWTWDTIDVESEQILGSALDNGRLERKSIGRWAKCDSEREADPPADLTLLEANADVQAIAWPELSTTFDPVAHPPHIPTPTPSTPASTTPPASTPPAERSRLDTHRVPGSAAPDTYKYTRDRRDADTAAYPHRQDTQHYTHAYSRTKDVRGDGYGFDRRADLRADGRSDLRADGGSDSFSSGHRSDGYSSGSRSDKPGSGIFSDSGSQDQYDGIRHWNDATQKYRDQRYADHTDRTSVSDGGFRTERMSRGRDAAYGRQYGSDSAGRDSTGYVTRSSRSRDTARGSAYDSATRISEQRGRDARYDGAGYVVQSSGSRQDSRDRVYDQPRDRMYDQPRDRMYDQPRDRMYDQPRDRMYDQPRDRMYDQPRDRVYDQPRGRSYDRRDAGSRHMDDRADRGAGSMYDRPSVKYDVSRYHGGGRRLMAPSRDENTTTGGQEFQGAKLNLVFHVMYYYCKPLNASEDLNSTDSNSTVSTSSTRLDFTGFNSTGSNSTEGESDPVRYSCPGIASRKAEDSLNKLAQAVNSVFANQAVADTKLSVEVVQVIHHNKQFYTYANVDEYMKCGGNDPAALDTLSLNWDPSKYVNVYICGGTLTGKQKPPGESASAIESVSSAPESDMEENEKSHVQISWDAVDPYMYNKDYPGVGNIGAKMLFRALGSYLGLPSTYSNPAGSDPCTGTGDGIPDTTPENITAITNVDAYDLLAECTTGELPPLTAEGTLDSAKGRADASEGTGSEARGSCVATTDKIDNIFNLASWAPWYCRTHVTPWQVRVMQMTLVAEHKKLYDAGK